MYPTCMEKQARLLELFAHVKTEEAKYRIMMDLGRCLEPLQEEERTSANLVKGCQSRTYLVSRFVGNALFFKAESDALISAGLAALLVQAYSGESPEAILKCPPSFLETLQLNTLLTPSRANGLYSMHLRMKQDALHYLK